MLRITIVIASIEWCYIGRITSFTHTNAERNASLLYIWKKSKVLSYFNGIRALLFWIWYTRVRMRHACQIASTSFTEISTWNFRRGLFSPNIRRRAPWIKLLFMVIQLASTSRRRKFYMARQIHDAPPSSLIKIRHIMPFLHDLQMAETYWKVFRGREIYMKGMLCCFILTGGWIGGKFRENFPVEIK